MVDDKIFINNIPTKAIIGINTFERISPQKIMISLELHTSIQKAAASENINDALNYDEISQEVDQFVQASNYQLIEALAENLAQRLLEKPLIHALTLKLTKPGAISYTQQVGVEIYRKKQ